MQNMLQPSENVDELQALKHSSLSDIPTSGKYAIINFDTNSSHFCDVAVLNVVAIKEITEKVRESALKLGKFKMSIPAGEFGVFSTFARLERKLGINLYPRVTYRIESFKKSAAVSEYEKRNAHHFMPKFELMFLTAAYDELCEQYFALSYFSSKQGLHCRPKDYIDAECSLVIRKDIIGFEMSPRARATTYAYMLKEVYEAPFEPYVSRPLDKLLKKLKFK